MTTDLAVWQPTGQLAAWQAEFEAAATIASSLSLTDFIPESLKKRDKKTGALLPQSTAATVAAALLAGQELGLGPMASLRSVDVVNGTPALRAIALRALVLAAGHQLWLVSATDHEVVYAGQRAGSEHVQQVVWDEARARALKLWDKPTWRMQQRNMLIARATAEMARLVAPERVLGLGYTSEEVRDDIYTTTDAESAPAATTAPRRAKRARRPAAALADAPEAPAEATVVPDEPPLDVPGISEGQLAALHAAFRDIHTDDRDDQHALLSAIIGRDVASSTELSAGEAAQAIHAVRQMAADEADAEADDDDSAD